MAGGWYGDSAAHRQAALLGWANRRGGGMRRYGGNSMHTRRTETLTLEEAAQLRRMRQRAAGKTAPAPRPARPPAAPRAGRETRPAPAKRDFTTSSRYQDYTRRRHELVEKLQHAQGGRSGEQVTASLLTLDSTVPVAWVKRASGHEERPAPAKSSPKRGRRKSGVSAANADPAYERWKARYEAQFDAPVNARQRVGYEQGLLQMEREHPGYYRRWKRERFG